MPWQSPIVWLSKYLPFVCYSSIIWRNCEVSRRSREAWKPQFQTKAQRIESNRFESRKKSNECHKSNDRPCFNLYVSFPLFCINRLKQQATTLYQPCPWRTRRRRRRPASSPPLPTIYRQQLFAVFEMQQLKEVFELLYRFESTFIDKPKTPHPPTISTQPAALVVQLHLVAVFLTLPSNIHIYPCEWALTP